MLFEHSVFRFGKNRFCKAALFHRIVTMSRRIYNIIKNYFIKSNTILLMLIVIFIGTASACSAVKKGGAPAPLSEDNFAADDDEGVEDKSVLDSRRKAASQALVAEPIGPELQERFAHLRGFGGHILIGNQRMHAVLQGVLPPHSYNQGWQPAILAFFERRETTWDRMRAGGSMDLQAQSAKQHFYATNVDTFVNRKTGQAMVTYVYSCDHKFAEKRMVRLLVNEDQSLLNVTLGGSDLLTNPWQLRWRRTEGSAIVNSTPHDSQAVGIAINYLDQEVLGIVNYGTQKTRTEASDLIIESKVNAAFKDQMFDVMIGKQANDELWLRASSLKQCSVNPSVLKVMELKDSSLEKREFLHQCMLLQKKAQVEIVLEKEPGKSALAPRRFIFKDHRGRDLFYSYEYPSKSLIIQFLPADKLSFVEINGLDSAPRPLNTAADGSDVAPIRLTARASLPVATAANAVVQPQLPKEFSSFRVPRLEVHDEEQQLSLAILPSTPELEKKWRNARPQNPEDLLAKFAKFAKAQAPDRVLELGCPSESISPAEYLKIVEKLQPNALALYDCLSARAAPEFFAAFARATQNGAKTIYLTSAKARDAGANESNEYIALTSEQDPSQNFIGGDYSLNSATFVQVESMTPQGKANPVRKALKLTAALHSGRGVQPKVIAIFTENGKVSEEILKTAKEGEKIVLQFTLPVNDQWIRIEVKDDAKVLGSTNFMPLRKL
jgi:hypothetical protein